MDLNLRSESSLQIIKIGKRLTKEERNELERLLREFKNIFAWSYGDFKAYSPKIIQHALPLKGGAKLVRKKLRRMNPKLSPLVKEEL